MIQIIYIDMDGVLVDFESAYGLITPEEKKQYNPCGKAEKDADYDEIPNIYSKMLPLNGAIDAYKQLSSDERFKVYILSTAPWGNPSAWSDKLEWVKEYLGEKAKKTLILSHNKQLNFSENAYLIDDKDIEKTGQRYWKEKNRLIHFGEKGDYKNWAEVLKFFYK